MSERSSVGLYRTVSFAEDVQLSNTGAFEVQSVEGKHFWETPEDAVAFGERPGTYYEPDGFRIVRVLVPESVAGAMHRWEPLDGIGPARFVPLDLLPFCSVSFTEDV